MKTAHLVLCCFLIFSPALGQRDDQRSFDELHLRGVEQNPPQVRVTLATADGRSTYHFSDIIGFKLTFSSQQVHVYTIELSSGNVAGVSSDLVFIGPGITTPIHSLPGFAAAIACCGTKRRYLGRSPVTAPAATLSLRRLEQSPAVVDPLGMLRVMKLQPGSYAVFAQTRNVMRGWPKSQRDWYHKLSDLTVTSENVVHITVLPDTP